MLPTTHRPKLCSAVVGTFEHRCYSWEDYGFHLSFCRISIVIEKIATSNQKSPSSRCSTKVRFDCWGHLAVWVWYPVCQHNDVSSCCWSVFSIIMIFQLYCFFLTLLKFFYWKKKAPTLVTYHLDVKSSCEEVDSHVSSICHHLGFLGVGAGEINAVKSWVC